MERRLPRSSIRVSNGKQSNDWMSYDSWRCIEGDGSWTMSRGRDLMMEGGVDVELRDVFGVDCKRIPSALLHPLRLKSSSHDKRNLEKSKSPSRTVSVKRRERHSKLPQHDIADGYGKQTLSTLAAKESPRQDQAENLKTDDGQTAGLESTDERQTTPMESGHGRQPTAIVNGIFNEGEERSACKVEVEEKMWEETAKSGGVSDPVERDFDDCIKQEQDVDPERSESAGSAKSESVLLEDDDIPDETKTNFQRNDSTGSHTETPIAEELISAEATTNVSSSELNSPSCGMEIAQQPSTVSHLKETEADQKDALAKKTKQKDDNQKRELQARREAQYQHAEKLLQLLKKSPPNARDGAPESTMEIEKITRLATELKANVESIYDEPPTTEEIHEFAEYLGMNIEEDRDLLYIAEWAMTAPLPTQWSVHLDSSGNEYFYNATTKTSQYDHPMDQPYRQLYLNLKRVAKL